MEGTEPVQESQVAPPLQVIKRRGGHPFAIKADGTLDMGEPILPAPRPFKPKRRGRPRKYARDPITGKVIIPEKLQNGQGNRDHDPYSGQPILVKRGSFSEAIRRVLSKQATPDMLRLVKECDGNMTRLGVVAHRLVDLAMEGNDWAVKMVADRLDGLAAQKHEFDQDMVATMKHVVLHIDGNDEEMRRDVTQIVSDQQPRQLPTEPQDDLPEPAHGG